MMYNMSCHFFLLYLVEEEGSRVNTGKSLAIVVGVAAALVLVAIFFMFLKSLRKKGDGTLLLVLISSFIRFLFENIIT